MPAEFNKAFEQNPEPAQIEPAEKNSELVKESSESAQVEEKSEIVEINPAEATNNES